MSLQVFLQVHLFGAEEFLSLGSSNSLSPLAFIGRCAWLTLFCEVLPRALLAELKLSPMLLGSSSSEQFLLVLAEEDLPRAASLLEAAAGEVRHLSSETLRLHWTNTENLGSWPIARKRLDDARLLNAATPLAGLEATSIFTPVAATDNGADIAAYFEQFAEGQLSATSIGYTTDRPGHLQWDAGQFIWALKEQSEPDNSGILYPRRVALDDEGKRLRLPELARRSNGAAQWGILIGDVDQFDTQLKSVGTVEEHIHLSILLKEFFAGELALLCTMPDFWRKVTVLYRGGDDFAVLGSWDALLALARELQRLFDKFGEHNLQAAAHTISMSLAVAPEVDAPIESVYEEALIQLRRAKAVDAGTFRLFGRTLEWKRLADAEELKSSLMRLVKDFGFSAEYIHDLASVYREAVPSRSTKRKSARIDKPWRTYMRLAAVIPQARGKELNNVRNAVITSLIGKRTASLKLRPSGRVGLEWARLASGNGS